MTIPKTVHFLPFMLRRSDGLAGVTRSMVTLCSELNRRGEVVIVTLEDDALAEHARSAGVETISLAPPSGFDHGRVGSIVRAARAIRGVAKDLGADLVHAHSAPACRFAWPAAASLGVPLVSHQRDIYKNNNFHRGLGRARLRPELAKTPLGQALAPLMSEDADAPPEPVESLYPPLLPHAQPQAARPQGTAASVEAGAAAVDARAFWHAPAPLPEDETPPADTASVPAMLVKKGGDFPPFWDRSQSFIAVMEELYRRVKSKHKQRL